MLSDNRMSLSKYTELLSEVDTFNVGLINERKIMIDVYKKCTAEGKNLINWKLFLTAANYFSDPVNDECKAAKNFLECINNEKQRIENFFSF